MSTEQSLMSLWKHECIRVISDRFTNQPDKDWFEKTMKRVVGEELGDELQAMIEDIPYLVDFLRFVHAGVSTCSGALKDDLNEIRGTR